jgi:hypothetical protein
VAVRRALLAGAATVAAGLAVPATAVPAAAAAPPAATAPAAARPPAAPSPEQTVTGTYTRLAKDHFDADGGLAHEYEDVLRVPGKAIRLRLPRGHALKPGSKVTVSALTASGGTLDVKSVSRVAPAALPPAGTASVIVILAYWTKPDSVTQASATSKVFGDAHNWFKEVSYGKAGLTGVVTPWVRIPPPSTGRCYADSEEILGNARNKAGLLGGKYVPSQYQRTIVYFPRCSGGDTTGVAGWAYEPGDSAWLNGYLDRRTTVHEQGHNYGLGHARSLTCTTSGGARTTFSKSCSSAVYGDPYDAMGRSTYAAHFTGYRKDLLGWLGSRKRVMTTTSSTFTLPPFEKPSSLPNVVVAQSNRVTGRSYWLEYRRPVGMDARLPSGATGGVLVHLQEPGRPGWLLDGTPGDGTFTTAVIKAGRSWTAPDYVKISVGSITSTGARVTVTGARAVPVAPSAPRNVVAAPRDSSAVITWSAPSSDGRSPITGYYAVITTAGGERHEFFANPDERRLEAYGLTNGATYSVKLVAQNEVGSSPAVYATVKPYTMAPSVKLRAPLAGATLTGSVTFTATATPHPVSDASIECVTFFIDDVPRGTDCVSETSTYSAAVPTYTLANGTHQVTVAASDATGRTGTDGPYSVQVDNPQPEVAWVTPAAGAVIDDNQVRLEVDATLPNGDPAQIAELVYYDVTDGWDRWIAQSGHYYDPQYYYWAVNTPLSAPYLAFWDTTHLNGKRRIVAQVRDLRGLVVRTAPVEVTINHPPSTITITKPGTTVSGAATTVAADVVPGSARTVVDRVEFWAGGRYLGADLTAPYELPWDISTLSGSFYVEARVVETSGRTYSATARAVHVANVLPRVGVTSPSYYAEIGPVVHQLRGTAKAGTNGEAPDRVVVSVDDVVVATVAPAADGTWSVPWDGAGRFGYHTLTAKALTPAGLAATSSVPFYVVHPRPVTTVHTPAPGGVVLAGAVSDFVLSVTPRGDDPTTVTSVCVTVASAHGCATAPGDDGRYRIPLDYQGTSGTYYPRATVRMSDGWTHNFDLTYIMLARPPRPPATVAVTGAPGALKVEITAPPRTEPVGHTSYVLSVGDRTVTVSSSYTMTTTTVTGLTDGVAYDVAVRAVNAVGTGTPTTTAGRPGAATQLVSVTPPAVTTTYGDRALWSARLTDAAGAGLAGRTVALDSCTPSTPTAEAVCTEAATAVTGAEGEVSLSAEVTNPVTLRLRYAGDETTGSVSARSAQITVIPRLLLTMPESASVTGYFTVQAEVRPSGYGYAYLEYRRTGTSYPNSQYIGYVTTQRTSVSVRAGDLGVGTYTVRLTMYDYNSGRALSTPEQAFSIV